MFMLAACVSSREPKLAQICSAPDANVAIASDGAVAWNGTPFSSDEALSRCMTIAAATKPRPKVRMQTGTDVKYEKVVPFFNAAQRAGLKLTFIVEPNPK